MRYGNRGRAPARGDGGSFWISYSDLMSALLLMFVLIVFISVYRYFDMLETKSAELEQQSSELQVKIQELGDRDAALQAAQLILAQRESDLAESRSELEAAQTKLTEAEQELLIQQAALELARQQLSENQQELSAQQSAVARAEDALADAQAALADQQALVDSQQARLDQQQMQLDQLVGVRTQIVEQLIHALSSANITGAQVDDSGAIVFQSEMMFDKNRAVLKEQGKLFLDSFIPGYIRVLMRGENAPYVSQVIVEGHADTDGNYLTNMSLSQQRAFAVLEYMLSDEFTAITSAEKEWLRQIVTVNGRSSVDPVYDEQGLIDKDASRRVVIKFRLNDENLVDSMLALLESMD